MELVREMYGDSLYEYYPLGKYIVAAPGICGGRPTFKYTRLEVSVILSLIALGETVEQVGDGLRFGHRFRRRPAPGTPSA
jgi:hypothetical protein